MAVLEDFEVTHSRRETDMEFKELLAAFAAKYGIEGLDSADGAVELNVEGVRVEL